MVKNERLGFGGSAPILKEDIMTQSDLSRQEYLAQLESKLTALPESDRKSAFVYYDNYIQSSEDEAATMAKLGAPGEVATDILASYIRRQNQPHPQTTHSTPGKEKRHKHNLWWVYLIIGIFLFPVIIGLAGGVFGITVGVGGALFAFLASGFTMVITGAASLILSVFVMFQDVGFGFITAGTGLVLIGIGIFFIQLTLSIVNWFIKIVRKTVRRYQNGRTSS